jgi:ABC-2 type transport system permease protein
MVMSIAKELRAVYFISLKDIKSYYFKPPNISWGIIFPVAMALAFYLRNPVGMVDLIPGLLGMTILFGATSMEAVVITFERRLGSFERLLLAPVSLEGVLMGKIAGGAFFGFIVSSAVLVASLFFFSFPNFNLLFLIPSLILSALAFSAMGAFISVAVKEVFEAQTLANLFRFPMIFLSGVFIPIETLPLPIQVISYFLPLTYSVESLRMALLVSRSAVPYWVSIFVLMIFSLALYWISVRVLRKRLG